MPDCVITLPKWHDKQRLAFESTASEILFAGDTRAGKSFFVRKSYIIWCSQIPGLQTDIFRLHFDDVIAENMDGETSFPVLLSAWEKAGLVKINQTEIVFWNDSKISLEHCSDDTVMLKHRGIAKHVRTFSESSQILEHRIRALTGWVTMSEEMKERVPEKWKGQFPKVLHVTNPIGISCNYYRRNFVDFAAPYSLNKVGQHIRQYIPAFLDDNPSEDAEQTKARIFEAFPDVAAQKALINSDKSGISNWHAMVGEFFPQWNHNKHVVSDFYPPHHWFRFRTFDWGYAEPFAVYWIAVSDGEPFIDEFGQQRWFPRGCLIVYQEWYGCDERNPAQGLRMRNEDVAAGIINRSESHSVRLITLTDSKPFQSTGGDGIDLVFQRNGVPLEMGDCSRIAGWSQLGSRLTGIKLDDTEQRYAMIVFCERCRYAISYIPALPRHPSESKKEDAAEHGEATHSSDAVRLGCMAHSHKLIKDLIQPMDTQIQRAIKEATRPTIKKLIGFQSWMRQ